MEYKIWLGILSLLIGFVAYFIYFRQILFRQVIPHPFSWAIWGLVESIAFTAQFVKHGGAGSWATGFTGLACFAVAALAFFYCKRVSITKIDWVFLFLALSSIVLWVLTKEPTLSVILLVLTDALGMVFTLRKTYLDPFKESLTVFGFSCIRASVAIFALQSYSLNTWLYPACLIFTNALVVIMILSRRYSLKTIANVPKT